MDASKLPLPPACTGNEAAVLTEACGAALQPICAGASSDADGTMRSLLIDPASNCFNWMNAVQAGNASVAGTVPGSAHLDAAMAAYCGGAGSLTAECACVAFPTNAAAWCEAGAAACPSLPHSACAAQQFAQTAADAGSLDVIQFTSCNPYYCWLGACYETPLTQLLPADILASQSAVGVCAGICGQVINAPTINIPPMPPGSFWPASITANVSGIGSCGAMTDPALLVAQPQTWVWPSNAVMAAPFFITNDGDYPAQVSVSSASLGAVCALAPGNNLVLGRSAQQFAISCDQPTVAAWYAASATYDPQTDPRGPPSLTINPEFQLSYLDLVSGSVTTTPPMGITAVITAPSAPMVVTRPAIPVWFWLVLAAALAAVVVQLVLIGRATRGVSRLLADQGISLTAPAP